MENGRMTGRTKSTKATENQRFSSPILFLKMPKKDNVGVGFAIYQSQISKLSHKKLTIFV